MSKRPNDGSAPSAKIQNTHGFPDTPPDSPMDTAGSGQQNMAEPGFTNFLSNPNIATTPGCALFHSNPSIFVTIFVFLKKSFKNGKEMHPETPSILFF